MPEAMQVSDEIKAALGQPGRAVVYEVTAAGIRLFARAVGYRSPIYYDEDAARAQGHPSLPAPPGYFGTPRFNPLAPLARRPGGAGPFRRTLNGGTEVEPVERVYAGDVLEAVTTLTQADMREGRLGPMLVRVSETVYRRQPSGSVVARTRGTNLSY